MANVNVTIRMDENVKKEAEELFSDLGLTLSSAINVFVKQAIKEQRIPFILSRDVPNKETLKAIKEIEALKNDPNKKIYNSFDEIVGELNEE